MGSAESTDASGGNVWGGVTSGTTGSGVTSGSGVKLLEAYADTQHSKSRSELVRKLAHALNTVGFKLPTENTEDIVKELKKQVPNPKEKRFTSVESKQKDICEKIAKGVNAEFGHIIDEKATAAQVCEEVAELVYSLGTSSHADYITIRSTLQKALKNLNELNDVVRASYDNLVQKVLSGEDEALKAEVPNIRTFYDELNAMIKHQLVVMSSVLNQTLSPVDPDLVRLLQSNEEYRAIVKEIKKGPGSEEFGAKIGYLLYGVSTAAQIAKVVEDALKQVGLSASEWKKTSSLKDLREDIYQLLKKKMSSASHDELTKFFKASEVLYKYQSLKPEIEGLIKGGLNGCGLGGYKGGKTHRAHKLARGHKSRHHGGGDDSSSSSMTLDKRVEREKKLRETLNKSFSEMFDQYLGNMMFALNEVSKLIGKDIPIDDDHLIQFWKSLFPLKDITNRNLYYSLSGFFNDAKSRQVRESYLGYLTASHDAASHLVSHSKSVQDYRDAIKALIDLIDMFSSQATAKRSVLGDPKEEVPAAVSASTGGDDVDSSSNVDSDNSSLFATEESTSAESADDTTGGFSLSGILDAFGMSSAKKVWQETGKPLAKATGVIKTGGETGGVAPPVAQSVDTFARAIKNFDFFYRVARLRKNLSKASSELKYYNEGYDKMLGEAIAYEIRKEQEDFAEVHKAFEYVYNDRKDRINKSIPENDREAELKKLSESRKDDKKQLDVLEQQKDARINMYRVAESIDKYLRLFTDAVSANPDSMHELVKILDGVTVISEWFTRRSGDNLAALFESFKSNTGTKLDHITLDKIKAAKHYYDTVSTDLGKVGDPAKQSYDMVESEKLARNTMNSLAVLKNIISTFVSIGDKFGTRNLYNETHLTPKQLHDALVDYIVASAFKVTFEGVGDPTHVVKRTGDDVYPKGEHMMNIPTTFTMSNVKASDEKFAKTDKLFKYCIKSIVAKIFTAVGVFTVMERPSDKQHSMSPVRLILGGEAGGAHPEVIPEAMELYIRLPLLAEFYRDLFAIDNWGDSEHKKFAMLPEIGGPFAGLVMLIFDTAKYVSSESSYSDNHVREIIKEVNHIYKLFSKSKDVTNTVVTEFIAEVNRRYGLIKKDEWDAYQQARRDEYKANTHGEESLEETSNYSILPNELEDTGARKLSPSDQFLGMSTYSTDKPPNKRIESSHHKLVSSFRKMISNKVSALSKDEQVFSFDEHIRQLKTEVHGLSGESDKYRVVFRAIQGMNKFSKIGDAKMIFFHETVVTGLTTLYAVRQVLKKFSDKVRSMDIRKLDRLMYLHKDDLDAWTKIKADPSIAKLNPDYYNAGASVVSSNDRGNNVNRPKVLQELIDLLHLTSIELDGLVDVKLDLDTFTMDYSKLMETVTKQFEYVKMVLNKFRGNVSEDVIRKYEDVSYRGSVFWLEEKLIDKYVNNQPDSTGAPETREGLERIVETVNEIKKALFNSQYEESYRVYVTLYKDLVKLSTAATPVSVDNTNPFSGLLLAYKQKSDKGATLAGDLYHGTYSKKDKKLSRGSLVVTFNALLAKYLELFYDNATNKMYLPVIDSFANGVFSSAVMDPNNDATTLNDLTTGALAVPWLSTTSSDIVLFRSLAQVMNVILTDVREKETTVRLRLVTNLADVPLHMRESYKCNMPMFVKLLDSLARRSELIKGFIRLGKSTATEEDLKLLGEQCDAVSRACFALRSCAVSVLKELNDSPQFGELSTGFLQDYVSMYNMAPFTPHSFTSYGFSNAVKTLSTSNILFPNYTPGSAEFKFNFALRGVMRPASHVSLSEMPGMKDILEAHNGSVTESLRMDSHKFGEFLNTNLSLTRYVLDLMTQRRFLTDSDVGFDDLELSVSRAGDKLSSYETRANSLYQVVSLIESNFQDDRKADLLTAVKGVSEQAITRSSACVLNLIDLNVVPINIHALQRELPLAPIYNYSYTFDCMVKDMFNSEGSSPSGDRKTMCELFTKPYGNWTLSGEMLKLREGKPHIKLGKPKFISDEVAGKSLFLAQVSPTSVNPVGVDNTLKQARLDTKFLRNIVWLVNLQRLIRYKLRSDIVYIDRPVVTSHKTLNWNITELEEGETDLKWNAAGEQEGSNYKWKSEEYAREFHGKKASERKAEESHW